jgi:type VI secretion system protein VasG
MKVNLKGLIGRLNDTCRSALEGAAGLCLSRTNYDVEIEHLLLKLMEVADTDLARVLRQYEIDASHLNKDVTRALDRLKTGNSRTPALSPRIPQLVEDAWLLASVDFGASKIRSGHLVLALLANEDLARLAREISKEFANVSVESLRKNLAEITAGTAEDKAAVTLGGPSAAAAGGGEAGVAAGKTQALDQYTVDLTAKARKGAIDPVLGRDFEIRQVIDILPDADRTTPS